LHTELENDDLKNYKAKAEFYIRNHQNEEAIAKLKSNIPLTQEDVQSLEKILWSEVGSKKDYEAEYGAKPLGEFVREIVGLDMAAAKDAYPHATSSATGTTDAVAAARNVIDSFRSNQSDKANWPNQCWNPGTDTTNSWIKIDFGRNVKVNTLEILLRAAASDSHYTDAIVELSDGSTIEVALHRTADAIEVDLGGVTTSSLTIKGFVKAGSAVAPITEIAVYGTEA